MHFIGEMGKFVIVMMIMMIVQLLEIRLSDTNSSKNWMGLVFFFFISMNFIFLTLFIFYYIVTMCNIISQRLSKSPWPSTGASWPE